MDLTHTDALEWIKSNVSFASLADSAGNCKQNCQLTKCDKFVHGDNAQGRNSKGHYVAKCMSTSCEFGEQMNIIDFWMKVKSFDFKEAFADLCRMHNIEIVRERYVAPKNKSGWRKWIYRDEFNRIQLIIGRKKKEDCPDGRSGAYQSRPASEDEVKFGFALAENIQYDLDGNGARQPLGSITGREITAGEKKMGFALLKEPVKFLRTRGANQGKPVPVKYDEYNAIHLVNTTANWALKRPYLYDKWHKNEGSVLVVEGEKDADVAMSLGYAATTNAGGSAKIWGKEISESLSGRDRYHFRDNDLAGLKSLINREATFRSIAGNDYYIELDQGPLRSSKGEDLRDWLQAHNDDEFKELFKTARLITPELASTWQKQFDEAKEVFRNNKAIEVFVPSSPIPEAWNEEYDINDEPFFSLSDTGNAERFCHRFKGRFAFVPEGFKSEWLLWDGGQWIVDKKAKRLTDLTKEIPLMIRRQAKSMVGSFKEEAIEATQKYALTCEGIKTRENILKAASSEPEVLKDFEKFDRHHTYMNLQNCVIDLMKREPLPHHPKYGMTKKANVVYDPEAKCPQFLKFLDHIFFGKKEIIGYVQRRLGYALTGLNIEEGMVFFVGEGANGKGALMEAIEYITGDYSQTSDSEMLMSARAKTAASSEIARLMGVRLAFISETNQGDRLDEARLKKLCSHDTLTARFNNKDPFEFRPTHSLFAATNNLPDVRAKDRGFWRRIGIVEFKRNLKESEFDKQLQSKLQAEASGIFNWLLDGLQDYLDLDGFNPPDEVLLAIEDYKKDNDPLAEFFEDYCEIDHEDEGLHASKTELFDTFYDWQTKECRERDPYSKIQFGKWMKQRKFHESKSGSSRYWTGIRLLSESERKEVAAKAQQDNSFTNALDKHYAGEDDDIPF